MAAILFGYPVNPIAGFVVAGGYFWWRYWRQNRQQTPDTETPSAPRQTPDSEPPSAALPTMDRETPVAQEPTPAHQIPPYVHGDESTQKPFNWPA